MMTGKCGRGRSDPAGRFPAAGPATGPGRGPAAACAAGPHAGGRRHGPWRIVHPDGSVEEGRYVAGRLHGEWGLRDPSGAPLAVPGSRTVRFRPGKALRDAVNPGRG